MIKIFILFMLVNIIVSATLINIPDEKEKLFDSLSENEKKFVREPSFICYINTENVQFYEKGASIAYRYEVLSVAGSGAYAILLSAFDHCYKVNRVIKVFLDDDELELIKKKIEIKQYDSDAINHHLTGTEYKANEPVINYKYEDQFSYRTPKLKDFIYQNIDDYQQGFPEYFVDGLFELNMLKITSTDPDNHCMHLISGFNYDDKFFIVLNQAMDMDLSSFEHHNHNKPMKIKMVKLITRKVLKCLQFLHSKKIAHNDVKLKNILIKFENDRKIKIVLTDFGQSCREDLCGWKRTTPQIEAPEIYTLGQGSTKSDMYSLGLVVMNLVTGHSIMQDESMRAKLIRSLCLDQRFDQYGDIVNSPLFNRVASIRGRLYFNNRDNVVNTLKEQNQCLTVRRLLWPYRGVIPTKDFENLVDFVENLLKIEPKLRLTAQQALNHKFLKRNDE